MVPRNKLAPKLIVHTIAAAIARSRDPAHAPTNFCRTCNKRLHVPFRRARRDKPYPLLHCARSQMSERTKGDRWTGRGCQASKRAGA
jgi:hypothetical protein